MGTRVHGIQINLAFDSNLVSNSMDKQEFRTKLEQLADIEVVTPRIIQASDSKGDEPQLVEFEGEMIEIERLFNPTLGIRLVRLKPRMQACELNCGKIVDRQVMHQLYYQTPEPHWRTKCATCGNYQHPDGGIIDASGTTVANKFSQYFRDRARNNDTQKIMQSKPRP